MVEIGCNLALNVCHLFEEGLTFIQGHLKLSPAAQILPAMPMTL